MDLFCANPNIGTLYLFFLWDLWLLGTITTIQQMKKKQRSRCSNNLPMVTQVVNNGKGIQGQVHSFSSYSTIFFLFITCSPVPYSLYSFSPVFTRQKLYARHYVLGIKELLTLFLFRIYFLSSSFSSFWECSLLNSWSYVLSESHPTLRPWKHPWS